ncbi:integral membrane protein [Phlyctema vagabunda]|uniref:Integral membrane protein n=1 Tax=Phlyctema vagabunda TaxID=108571 RepID=A0ABR4PI95_9HELO
MRSITAYLTIVFLLAGTIVFAKDASSNGSENGVGIILKGQSAASPVSDPDVNSFPFELHEVKRMNELIPRNRGNDGEARGSNGGFIPAGNGRGPEGARARRLDTAGVRRARVAHGVVMAGVMLLIFPVGSLLMRVLGRWYIHAAFQFLGLIGMLAGLGLGIYLARERDELFNNIHTILGLVVVILLATVQPILGFLQHRFFRKNNRRGATGHLHLWLGRALMALGIVNGGLGLRLSREDGRPRLAYIIIAAIMGGLYIITVVIFSFRKKAPQEVIVTKRGSISDVSYTEPPAPLHHPAPGQKQDMYV